MPKLRVNKYDRIAKATNKTLNPSALALDTVLCDPLEPIVSNYLPAPLVSRKDNPMNTELIVLTFDSPTGADAMLQTLKELQADDFIELLEAVVVTKDSRGKVEVRQPLNVGPGRGAAFGAVSGAVIGLLGGPGGAVVGLVSGAVTGAATAAAIEAGVPKAGIESLAVDELEPGESALLVYLDEVWIDQIEQTAADLVTSIAVHSLAEEHKIAREKAAQVRKEEIDAAYKSWQAKIDKLHTSVTSLRQQAVTSLQADQAAIQKQIHSANAKLDATYKEVLHTLQAWQRQIDTNIHELEAEAKQANAAAKADIERRLASDREARQAVRTHVKDTLAMRLNSLKTDIDNLKSRAVQAQGQAKEKLDQRVAKLQADLAAERKRLDALDKANDAAWDQMVKSIDQAFDTFDASMREAETESKSEKHA
jgi:uncharacterized membrane protein